MQTGRAGRIILIAVVLIAGTVAVGTAPSARPLLARGWATAVSFVSAWSVSSTTTAPTGTTNASSSRATSPAPHRQTAPLSSAQLGAPLVHGTMITACGAPDDLKVVVTVGVKMGRAVDVAVKTVPTNSAVAACIERATRELQWDISPKLEHVTVTY
jgi:hypothetical protein